MDIRKKKLQVTAAARGLFNVSSSRIGEAMAYALGFRSIEKMGNRKGNADDFSLEGFVERLTVLENEKTAKSVAMLLSGHRMQISVDTMLIVELASYKKPVRFQLPEFPNAKMKGVPMDEEGWGVVNEGKWVGIMEGWQHPSTVRGALARAILCEMYDRDILPEV